MLVVPTISNIGNSTDYKNQQSQIFNGGDKWVEFENVFQILKHSALTVEFPTFVFNVYQIILLLMIGGLLIVGSGMKFSENHFSCNNINVETWHQGVWSRLILTLRSRRGNFPTARRLWLQEFRKLETNLFILITI